MTRGRGWAHDEMAALERERARVLATVETWPCLLATPIRIMSDTREARPRPPLYDVAPRMAPATGIPGEAVMLVAPRTRGGSSAAVVGERDTIRAMAERGGRRVLEVATIDGQGCLVPAAKAKAKAKQRKKEDRCR